MFKVKYDVVCKAINDQSMVIIMIS